MDAVPILCYQICKSVILGPRIINHNETLIEGAICQGKLPCLLQSRTPIERLPLVAARLLGMKLAHSIAFHRYI